MSSPLWLVIDPRQEETRLLLVGPPEGTALKARLPRLPRHPRAAAMLLESIAAWFQRPITAVLDADASRTQIDPTSWSELLADLPGIDLSVAWVETQVAPARRDRFFEGVADMRTAKRLLSLATQGRR